MMRAEPYFEIAVIVAAIVELACMVYFLCGPL